MLFIDLYMYIWTIVICLYINSTTIQTGGYSRFILNIMLKMQNMYVLLILLNDY